MHPLNEYTVRQDRWTATCNRLEKQFLAIGNWRLLASVSFFVLLWLAWAKSAVSALWLLVPVTTFVVLAVWHARVIRERTLARRAIAYYRQGLARLEGRWMGAGNSGGRFLHAEHPYSADLDIFGRGSLFELVSTARTSSGESLLASWLLTPGNPDEVISRQDAIRELLQSVDLREDLALLGEDVHTGVHTENLTSWGSAPEIRFPFYLRPLSLTLAITGVALLLAFFAQLVPLWPFVAVLSFDFVVIVALRKRVAQVLASIETPGQDLATLALILKRLERDSFQTSRLKQLRADLNVEGVPASQRIARLQRWVATIDSSDHLLIRAVRPILLWQEQLAMGVEAWRAQAGKYVGAWLRAVSEFEALSSLAALSFEHPNWSFPELVVSQHPIFEARSLLHPLLSSDKCVPNDVVLGSSAEHVDLLIVSGSNMSGKSTLLRSIGLNTVLAWAGAPIAAKQLRLSNLQIGASLRVVDSLQDGRSRFMAEIVRLRQIVSLTEQQPPVLFLLDELLSGTNSHDRRLGASAIVRGLLHRGAIGLVTTHDLALADLEKSLNVPAANVHFEDSIVDGNIEFDYLLRPGVVARSNALELMRAVGLEV